MKTREQVLTAIKNGRGRGRECLDGRDYCRLAAFFPATDWPTFKVIKTDGTNTDPVIDFTEENVLKQLKEDLAFGFNKALDKRGLSADAMHTVVQMWLWVLDAEDEFLTVDYAQYGLPLFKAVALKYGFPNPIGNDNGDEQKYAS